MVDSRCAYGEEPAPDEGDMYPVLHAPERCLEIGRMERIKGSGVAVGYQELWVSLEAMVSFSLFFCRFWLESVDGLTCGCF